MGAVVVVVPTKTNWNTVRVRSNLLVFGNNEGKYNKNHFRALLCDVVALKFRNKWWIKPAENPTQISVCSSLWELNLKYLKKNLNENTGP